MNFPIRILLLKKEFFEAIICYLSGLGLASGWLSTWTPFSSVSTELPTDEDLYKQYAVSECGGFPTTLKINKMEDA
jgi:hypothetical protein